MMLMFIQVSLLRNTVNSNKDFQPVGHDPDGVVGVSMGPEVNF